jgi:hypothetical protein
MVRLYQYTTFDIMGDLTFGNTVGQLEGNQYSDWVQAVLDSIRSMPLAQFINYYPVLRNLFERFEPRVVDNKTYRHFRFAADCVDARLARGSDKPDIWSLVLSARVTAVSPWTRCIVMLASSCWPAARPRGRPSLG